MRTSSRLVTDGEQSSQELSFGLLALALLEGWLLHACIDNLICSQRNFRRTDGRRERGLSSRSTDIASLLTFSIRFSRLAVCG